MHRQYVKRVNAFMMAWHPRLGKNACISKIVSKDVARWFCKEYLIREKYGEIRFAFTDPKILQLPYNANIFKSYIHAFNRMGDKTMLMLQTPVLKTPFGMQKYLGGPEKKYHLALEIDESKYSHRRLQKNISSLENKLMDICRNNPNLGFRYVNDPEWEEYWSINMLTSIIKTNFNKITGEIDKNRPRLLNVKFDMDDKEHFGFSKYSKIVRYVNLRFTLRKN